MVSLVAYKAMFQAEEQRKPHPAVAVVELWSGLGAQRKWSAVAGSQNKRWSGDKNFVDPRVVRSVKVRGVATGCWPVESFGSS